MSRRGKRQTPFRFANLVEYKNDVYRVGGLTSSSANSGLSCGAKFFAVQHGKGGNIMLAPLSFQDYTRTDRPHVIQAHGSVVKDFQFSPHDDLLLATCGQSSVKTFSIPVEGLTENITEPTSEVKGLQPVLCLAWHPSASDILAVGAKNALYVLDMGAGEVLHEFKCDGYGKDVVTVAWNTDGSLIAAATKKGHLAVGDVRTAGADFMTAGVELKSSFREPQKVYFMGNKLCILGLNKYRKPTVTFWDVECLDEPLSRSTLNLSSGYILSFYDPESKLLWITVRGSSSITSYDVTENKQGTPKFVSTSTAKLTKGAKGGAFISKRSCDTDNAEVQRLLTLGMDGIYPHGIKVPRKVKGFDASLFPDTADVVPALTAQEWISGANKPPTTVNMEAPLMNSPWAQGSKKATAKTVATIVEEKKGPTGQYVATEARTALESKFKTSIHRHVKAMEPQPSDMKNYWYDMKMGNALAMGNNIKTNGKYWACTWPTGGGSAILVKPADGKKGRIPTKPVFFRGHKSQATTFDLSPLHPDRLISASAEGIVFVQTIPDGGPTSDVSDVDLKIPCRGRINRVWFHPFVTDVYVTAVTSIGDGITSINFHDSEGEARIEVEYFESVIESLCFHPKCRLVAVTTKDGKVRVVDVIANRVIKCFTPLEKRNNSVFFYSETKVIVCGFAARSYRSFSVWDVSGEGEATQTFRETFGPDTAMLVTHYDMDRKLLYVGHFGGPSVDLFELNDTEAKQLTQIPLTSDLRGWAWFHPSTVDTKKIEVARSLRITKTTVVPQSWTVPRRRKEFFQDDLYPETLACAPVLTADQFFDLDDEKVELKMVSLCPEGMTPLSQAPKEALTMRQKKYKAQVILQETPDDTEERSEKAAAEILKTAKTVQASTSKYSNRWDATPESGDEVDSDEWGSDVSDSD